MLDLPKSQFERTLFIHAAAKKMYENQGKYYGMVTLGVRKGTQLKYEVLGLIEGLKHSNLQNKPV